MTCLTNIVTSLLLISSASSGTTPALELGHLLSAPARSELHSDELPDVPTVLARAATEASVSSPPRAALRFIGVTTEQSAAVRRAVGLFDRAGLQLPPLVVYGHHDEVVCGNHLGVHFPRESWSEILLCAAGTSGFERSVIVHELAHAWAEFELSAESKAAFRARQGWEYWRDYERAAWRDNGTEQAAEVIAWGVYDRVAPIGIDFDGCDDLVEGYRALTGIDPVQGLTTLCEPSVERAFS